MSKHLKKILAGWLALALLIGAASACGVVEEEEPYGGEEARSDKQRITSPQVANTDLDAQVKGNTAFGLELYQQIRTQPGNLFYSPHSISLALAMLQAGAVGGTEQQLAHTMHYLPQGQLHPVLNRLDLELARRGAGAKAADGQPFRLNIVNAIWGQRGYPFQAPFLDTLALNYGAGLHLLNFMDQPDPSRLTINSWVEQKTEKRIKDLLPQGSITSMTRLVLTNAIYFNAAWADPFKAEQTQDEAFTKLDGSKKTVSMMNGTLEATFTKGSGYHAAALPYDRHELSMLVIVPDAGTFASFEQGLTAKVVDGIVSQLKQAQVTVKLPRFEFTQPLKLRDTLIAMGITDAFSDKADFSAIDGTRSLFVSEVLHKAFVKVNEKGTEAAAATAVVMAGSAMPDPATLQADRPFIFLIRDHATGAVLFVGRVVAP